MDWLLPVRARDGATSFEVTPHSQMLGTYGSFLMGCAVRAASATVGGMMLTGLRADFLTPPRGQPIRIDVEATRSGRSVAVRRVTIGQEPISAVMILTFGQASGDAPQWHPEPSPFGDAPDELDRYFEEATGLSLLDIRPVRSAHERYARRHPYWARPAQPFGDGPVAAAAAIAIATDHFVTAMATPQEEGAPRFSVTLDHTLWLHKRTHADEWLRYDADLVAVETGRALVQGRVSNITGHLVASFAQQALRREGIDLQRR
jgi:acyl-CoA thioesterase II